MTDPASETPQTVQGHRRRRFRSHLVNMDVRLRLVLDDVVFALVAAFLAIGILYFMSNREIGDNLYSAHISIKETRELLNNGVKVAGAVTFVAVLAFGFWSIMDAHRIAGPMHRLRRLLHGISEGDLTHEIKFRKRDEFQEIAEAADNVVDVYALRISKLRSHVQSALAELAVEELTPVQIRQLRERMAAIEEELGFFRLPDGTAPDIDNSPIA